jgi:fructose-1,6-bisphosphatase/inositol monophosphatase family enzyme
VTDPAQAVVVLNGYPPQHLGWRQYRALGATALDLCAVADGRVDATVDCATDALGPWDYLGAMLVLSEAGCVVEDLHGRDLVDVRHDARRTPVSAATPELLGALRGALLAARD